MTRRPVIWFLVAASFAATSAAPAPAFARGRSAALTLSDVLAHAKTANEPPISAKPQVQEWDAVADGLSGTQTVVRRGSDFTVTTRLGPFVTAWGRAGNQVWRQDENGITVASRERPDRVTARTLERVSSPVDAYVVLETFASGHVRRSYYDPRTFVLLRREKWVGGRFSYTAWDDFHAEAKGHVQAWHYQGEDADGTAFEYRLRAEREVATSEQLPLGVPRARRTLAEFPAAQRSARLPARFERGRILVRVGIGRRFFEFLLDTGASGIVLASEAAKELGLERYGSTRAAGAAPVASGRVIVPLMEVGTLRMRDVAMLTAPLADEERREHVSGLLGFDFIAPLALRIDYERGTLDAYEGGTLAQPPGSVALDVRLDGQVPTSSAKVGASSGDGFLIDTGAATTLLLFARFAAVHRADVADQGVGAALASSGIGIAANGIGGRIGIRPVQVRRFRFANVTFSDPIVYVADSPHALGLEGYDGLIGANVLSRFVLYLDYANSKIFLTPLGNARP